MHDIHASNQILKLALKYAKKNNLSKIKKITVKLGHLIEHGQEVLPENLKFNIKMLAKGTIAEKTTIRIKKAKNKNILKLIEIQGD
ncbi:hypothetical protein CL633_00790 [bacterium]|nr:hypothetical protein [bacterium]|tara:strand:+ start:821 stop:1078 length:258 start_codon:yes stop_codon:yes gene_type:complete